MILFMIFINYLKNNCILQIGGSDQWGNIINGVELIRRIMQKILWTNITTYHSSIGCKNGKTEKGAVWLNKQMLSSYDYWQFWRNTDDRDVKKFLYFFTEIEIDEINKICEKEKMLINLKCLANEATKILHGETGQRKRRKLQMRHLKKVAKF